MNFTSRFVLSTMSGSSHGQLASDTVSWPNSLVRKMEALADCGARIATVLSGPMLIARKTLKGPQNLKVGFFAKNS